MYIITIFGRQWLVSSQEFNTNLIDPPEDDNQTVGTVGGRQAEGLGDGSDKTAK